MATQTTQHTLPYSQSAYSMSAYHQVPTTPSYSDPYATQTPRPTSIHQISSSTPTPDPYAAFTSTPPFLSPSLSNPSKYNSYHGLASYPAYSGPPLSASRSPHMSSRQHVVSVLLPLVGFLAILVGVWTLTLVAQHQPNHHLEITSVGFYRFGIQYPSLLVAFFTLVASILNAALAWCFAQSCIIYVRHRVSRPGGRPISLRGIAAFSAAKDGAWAVHPLGTGWMWLCIVCWATFLLTTTGFNTALSPTRRTVIQEISTSEIDMTSPSFASYYSDAADSGMYNCGRWTQVRGLMLSPCPAGTAFTNSMFAGGSHFEKEQLGELSYLRLANLSFAGNTGGILPFTRFEHNQANSFDSAALLDRLPHSLQNNSISILQQGIRVAVSCRDMPSTPIDEDGNIACNPETPKSSLNPGLRMKAAWCGTADGGYEMHARFFGAYIHYDSYDGAHNQNVSCTIVPEVSLQEATWFSTDKSTWVKPPTPGNTSGAYPAALIERILGHIVAMASVFGQNEADNLFAEQIVSLTTAHSGGDYRVWPLVIQRQLEGIFSFLASYERVILENALQGNTDVERVLRTGTLQHDAFAFATGYITYLLLLPITLACVLGLFFLFAGTRLGAGHRPVHFDALDTISLITAAACGQLTLDKASQAGARPSDLDAAHKHVTFIEQANGSWGLVERRI